MKSFITATVLFAYFQSLALAAPAAAAPVTESNAQAAQNWMADTGKVSNFLNMAPTLKGAQFVAAAKIALAAELDELNHKAVLDAAKGVGQTAVVKAASAVLAAPANKFQDVVDLLQEMVNLGDQVAIKDTNAINTNRCKNVLPNIDVYLKAAGTNLAAVRPTACNLDSVVTLATPPAGGAGAGAGAPPAGGNGRGGQGAGAGAGAPHSGAGGPPAGAGGPAGGRGGHGGH